MPNLDELDLETIAMVRGSGAGAQQHEKYNERWGTIVALGLAIICLDRVWQFFNGLCIQAVLSEETSRFIRVSSVIVAVILIFKWTKRIFRRSPHPMSSFNQ